MPMRTFTSPSGRAWTVDVIELPSLPGEPTLYALRFVSGQVVFELEQWPTDWATLPDAELVELARNALPPRMGLPGVRALHQRH
ncbi:MAG TPA: hypothetical protein VMM18_05305 [Gemmatimonadaceae bacterium]|nr:hypothetical protein [Gemmatimonadaceae bacterium]